MKLIIAGSRSIKDYETVRQAVIASGYWKQYKHELEIVSGMAQGVDLLGIKFAKRNNLSWYEFPAHWNKLTCDHCKSKILKRKQSEGGALYNNKAGIDRNIKMGLFSDALLAVWDGESSGICQMINWMQLKEKPVFIYKTN